jgi:hypothetical protein
MSCRTEVLLRARELIVSTGDDSFFGEDLVRYMRQKRSRYSISTIRTHVTSRMCANAPSHHATRYPDFVRIGRGRYRFKR